MELVQKGASAEVGGFKQVLVSMKWTTAADFDLAALYETKSGQKDLVYFGKKGDMNAMPFMELSDDAGVGDARGDNEETMRIAKIDEMAKIWLLAWDYGKVQDGQPARFSDSDVSLSLMDDTGKNYDVSLNTGELGNVAVLAEIDNTSPIGAKLVNSSKVGTLKGLKDLNQLIEIVTG